MLHWGLIISTNHVGGIERQMQLLARGLLALGYKVTVIYTDYPRAGLRFDKAREIDYSGIPTIKLCTRKLFRWFYYPLGRLLLRRSGVNVVLGNNPENAYAGIQLTKGTDIPVVTHISGMKFSRVGCETTRELLRYCIEHSSAVVSNAQVAIDTAKRMGLIHENKCTKVIHNGVLTDNKVSIPQLNRFNVIFVGQLYKIKDPFTLLHALEIAKTNIAYLTATFVGEGVLKEQMLTYIREHHLDSFITLTGHLPTEKIPYCESDLFVNCSISELSSGAIAEGLSHGLLAIGSNFGGTPEILRDNTFSDIFEPGDVNALAALIIKFGKKSLDERIQLGKQAYEYARKLFAVETYVHNYIEFGNEILKRKSDK